MRRLWFLTLLLSVVGSAHAQTCTYADVVDGVGGTNGSVPTAATLASGTHGDSTGNWYWDFTNPGAITYESSASGSLNWSLPFCSGGTYANASTLGFRYSTTVGGRSVMYFNYPTNEGTMIWQTAGVWISTNIPVSSSINMDIGPTITGSGYNNVILYSNGVNIEILCESVPNGCTETGGAIDIQNNGTTRYWVTTSYGQNGQTCSPPETLTGCFQGQVYQESATTPGSVGTLLGSWYSSPGSASGAASWVYIGNNITGSGTSGYYLNFDHLAICYTAKATNCPFPLLPSTSVPQAPTPIISPASGSYTSSQTVSMTCSASTPTIYYTTDGTTPTDSSTTYTGPFAQSIPATVEAICAASGYTNSPVATVVYTFSGPPAVSFSPTSLSFASQSTGTQSLAQTITLTNTGGATLAISLPITITGTNPADFVLTTSSVPCPASLAPGSSCQINVVFAPTVPGSRSASVSVTDNATGSPQTVPLSGTGVPGGGAGTIVQHTTAVCTPTVTCAATFASPVATGDYIIAFGLDGYGTGISITFADGTNTYTQALFGGNAYCNLATDGDTVGMSYAQAASSSAFTVTMADGGYDGAKSLAIAEATGLTGLDQTACEDSTGTIVSSGNTSTTTQGNEALFGFMGNSGAASTLITAGTGYSLLDAVPSGNNRIADEWQTVTSTGTYAATFAQSISNEAGVIIGTFEVTGAAPTISSLSATSGNIASTFTINGTGFGATQGGSTATLNGTDLTINSWSATAISVTIPSSGSTGNVVVTVSSAASNGVPFTVTPYLSSLSVSSGSVGTSVITTGTGFGSTQGASALAFNGTNCSPTNWSTTSIVCTVPAAATTGNVVATVGGNTSNGIAFTVTPYITGLSPTSGTVGSNVVISGTTFGASQGSSTVTFNGITATCSTWAASSLSCAVPASAATGNVVVTVASQASNDVSFTVAASPTISGVSPTSGTIGATVTITGANFGSSQGTSTVTFNGTVASVSGWDATTITCAVPAGATNGSIIVTVGSIQSNGVLFSITPYLSSLSVSSGPVGTSVTITGTGFHSTQGTSTVTFNGVACSVKSWSATSVTCPVPSGATTGSVIVNVGGNASNGVSFVVTPHITSLSPASGLVGSKVTISGTTFGSSQGSSTVMFNNATATCSSWTATSLSCTVPTTTTGNVVVTVSGQASNGVSFTVVGNPTISSVSPTSGITGATVTITGANFGSSQGTSKVTFNGVACSVTSWSATSITCKVPSGATTGSVIVIVGGNASNGVSFTVTPHITSLSPTSGPVGTKVTISGTTFGSSQGSSTVMFNNATATCSTWTATSLSCTVPTSRRPAT